MRIENTCKDCGEKMEADIPEDGPGIEQLKNLFYNAVICESCYEIRKQEREKGTLDEQVQHLYEQAKICGIPKEMLNWDSQIGNNDLLNKVWNNRSKSLWLASEYRTGKTRSVIRCASVMLWQNELSASQLMYWRVPDLRRYLTRLARNDDSEKEEREYQKLANVKLLILDDLDKGAMTDVGLETLWRIIDDRIARPWGIIWVTANQGGSKLAGKWTENNEYRRETAEAITARLREMCKPISVQKAQPA